MKIGIVAIGIRPAKWGGVEMYFRNLVEKLSEVDEQNEYYVFVDSREIQDVVESRCGANVTAVYYPPSRYFFNMLRKRPWTVIKILVNRAARLAISRRLLHVDDNEKNGCLDTAGFELDVIHHPFGFIHGAMPETDLPIVLTVHDLQIEYCPEFFDPVHLVSLKKAFRSSVERADMIVTISETTKQSLQEIYNVAESKIVVSYQGCARNFTTRYRLEQLKAVREKYGLPERFLFYPAGTWHHKNHVRLLEALALLKRERGFAETLVMTGIQFNGHKNFVRAVEQLGLEDQVKYINFVPFEDLPLIYNLASVLVFPSLFEGFGIPFVEAMHTGLPIVCSNTTSIPEIVGDAGHYFDPEDPRDIAEKVLQVWSDDDLKRSLIERGTERAQLFTSEQAALKTVDAYTAAALTLPSERAAFVAPELQKLAVATVAGGG
jgi:glycosyltransferase involved in cell wall biosynthesis